MDCNGDAGRSICTKPMADSSDLAGWLDELFTALDLAGKINLMGLSYGGYLAALYGLHFPSRLRKTVLLAPGEILRARPRKTPAGCGGAGEAVG